MGSHPGCERPVMQQQRTLGDVILRQIDHLRNAEFNRIDGRKTLQICFIRAVVDQKRDLIRNPHAPLRQQLMETVTELAAGGEKGLGQRLKRLRYIMTGVPDETAAARPVRMVAQKFIHKRIAAVAVAAPVIIGEHADRMNADAAQVSGGEFSAEIEYGGKAVGGCAGKVVHKRLFEAELSEKHLWEAGKGRLYGVRLQFEGDTVYSYFGLRDVRYEGKTFLLNGKPLFQRLVLDQGYYEKGIYTPEKEECFAEDIRLAREAGFNGARLHQKLFDPRYLFECDRTGFIVWGEYPSWGMEYHDLAGLGAFLGEWREAMERDFNRPSVITWCPLNEVWDDLDDARLGRDVRFVDAVYSFTKALDPTRPCVDVSGGTHGNRTDVADFHCYDVFEKLKERMEGAFRGQFDFMQMYREGEGIGYKGEPLNLSEFGGVSVGGDGWGYETAGSEEQFVADYERTVRYLLSCGQLSGFCYTQLYDVEQEQNGLYTYGRKPKFSEEGMRRIRAANEAPAAIEK